MLSIYALCSAVVINVPLLSFNDVIVFVPCLRVLKNLKKLLFVISYIVREIGSYVFTFPIILCFREMFLVTQNTRVLCVCERLWSLFSAVLSA